MTDRIRILGRGDILHLSEMFAEEGTDLPEISSFTPDQVMVIAKASAMYTLLAIHEEGSFENAVVDHMRFQLEDEVVKQFPGDAKQAGAALRHAIIASNQTLTELSNHKKNYESMRSKTQKK